MLTLLKALVRGSGTWGVIYREVHQSSERKCSFHIIKRKKNTISKKQKGQIFRIGKQARCLNKPQPEMRESSCVHFPQAAVFSSWTRVSTANILSLGVQNSLSIKLLDPYLCSWTEHTKGFHKQDLTLLRAVFAQLLLKGFSVTFAVQSTPR